MDFPFIADAIAYAGWDSDGKNEGAVGNSGGCKYAMYIW